MTEERDLLAAILANPDEDLLRLMYADWLQEHGEDEYAEFIRVQCELARLCAPAHPPPNGFAQIVVNVSTYGSPVWVKLPDRARAESLAARAYQLIAADPGRTLRWFDLPRPWARVVRLEPFDQDDREYPYAIAHRGFLDELRTSGAAWLAHADTISAAHPIARVRLMTWPTAAELVAAFEFREGPAPAAQGAEIAVTAAELLRLFAVWWPGIAFELPGAAETGNTFLRVFRLPGDHAPVVPHHAVGMVNAVPTLGFAVGTLRLTSITTRPLDDATEVTLHLATVAPPDPAVFGGLTAAQVYGLSDFNTMLGPGVVEVGQ